MVCKVGLVMWMKCYGCMKLMFGVWCVVCSRCVSMVGLMGVGVKWCMLCCLKMVW